MQIKSTARHHLTHVRVARVKKVKLLRALAGSGEKGALHAVGGKQPLWKTISKLLKELKTERPYDPLLDI